LSAPYNGSMTYREFDKSLEKDEPPAGISQLLMALWWDAKGDWSRAHEIAQEIESKDAAWVHAYLHRKEGNVENAGYWYGQARKPHCETAVEVEWIQIVRHLLDE
jgi:hypothetical protein